MSDATPLSEDRWRRLETLFVAAADLPPDARDAFIERETSGDAALRRDLAGMLAHAAGAGVAIARAVGGAASSLAPPGVWIGRRCGAYRITREVGRGGMGIVFEAVRDDDEYRKRVAVKIAPFGGDAALVADRFRLERQILADLEHPHIARFLDGGTADGVPYFVMEYVDGAPITSFCDEKRLDIDARIRLFQEVCRAVHFAHERLVVHRDLKPANILVDAAGVPKLLDFGIAKLLDPVGGGNVTATIERAWTPDYTSPEQVRGKPVTTRTDVYSLGLILYELLTGAKAQAADASSPMALDASIAEAVPALPSAQAHARGRSADARRLRGDLDTIVMTAIAKDPDRRYGSAAALSDDLGRHLLRRPIHARPASPMYRARRFVRRHRSAVAAAVLVAVSAAAGIASTLYEARRAQRRFDQVRTLANAFVFDVHDRIENLPGSTEARKAIVQDALQYLESLRADAGGDAALARELAAAYERVGHAQGNPLKTNLGDSAGALQSYTRAVDLLTPLAGRGDGAAQRQLVSVLLWRSNIFQARGDWKSALAECGRAETVGERIVADAPNDAETVSTLSDVYAADARSAVLLQDLARAERSSRRAIELSRRSMADAPERHDYADSLASAYNALGQTLTLTHDLEGAAASFRKSVEIREALVKEDPDNTEFRRNLMISYGNVGEALGYQVGNNLGDVPGAIAAFEKALDLARGAEQKDPNDRRAWSDIVNAEQRLGAVLTDAGRRDDALQLFEDGERRLARLREAEPKRYSYAFLDAFNERRLGIVLAAKGRVDDAARRFERSRAIAVGLIGDGVGGTSPRSQFIYTTIKLAALRADAGDPRAGALADEAMRELKKGPLSGSLPFNDALAYGDLGRIYLQAAKRSADGRDARLRQAAAALEQSAALWRAIKAPAAAESRRRQELGAVEALRAGLKHPA